MVTWIYRHGRAPLLVEDTTQGRSWAREIEAREEQIAKKEDAEVAADLDVDELHDAPEKEESEWVPASEKARRKKVNAEAERLGNADL